MAKYTPEQVNYLVSIVPGHTYKEIADLFNEQFNIQLTTQQVNSFVGNRKLNTGLTGRFEKGHIPFNKGEKGSGGWEPTQFKKGQRPVNYRPVGSERINVDGYCEIKVADPNKWRTKHSFIWEAANGPIPKNHVVIFGDGNRSNLDLDNLILVSRRELAVLNHQNLIQGNAELTQSAVLMTKLIIKCSDCKKNSKGGTKC